MRVPFQNYVERFSEDRERFKAILRRTADRDEFILKREVRNLEEAIQSFTGLTYAVGTASATAAMSLGARALGVGPGADALVPAFAYSAPVNVVCTLGANPIFVDVDVATGTMDPDELAGRCTPRSRVVIPVHTFSSLADMQRINTMAEDAGLRVLEDSAVALGARGETGAAGGMGEIGVYSFNPAKPCGGIADGGMVVTNDEAHATRCRSLRNHGQDGVNRFLHHEAGWNKRLAEATAAFVLVKLARLNSILEHRERIARRYTSGLVPLGDAVTPLASAPGQRAWHAFVVRAARRDDLVAQLCARGVETRYSDWRPLPLEPAFAACGHRPGEFPGAERLGRDVVAFPLYPELTDEQVDYVIDSVRAFYGDVA